ncbi:MAG: hypothetical protein M3Q48_00505 [Actinomycetota bacterium]|nr:hypothetical protein [Actinomycetota bacterium]
MPAALHRAALVRWLDDLDEANGKATEAEAKAVAVAVAELLDELDGSATGVGAA